MDSPEIIGRPREPPAPPLSDQLLEPAHLGPPPPAGFGRITFRLPPDLEHTRPRPVHREALGEFPRLIGEPALARRLAEEARVLLVQSGEDRLEYYVLSLHAEDPREVAALVAAHPIRYQVDYELVQRTLALQEDAQQPPLPLDPLPPLLALFISPLPVVPPDEFRGPHGEVEGHHVAPLLDPRAVGTVARRPLLILQH